MRSPRIAARRQAEFRARIEAGETRANDTALMLAAYRAGYADALAGKPPRPPAGGNAAIAYLAGGLDAA